jgi:hypothetical protein
MRGPNGEPVEGIDSLAGLSRTRPALAAAIAIFMFSLAGIPPLFGFWPKLLVFNAAVDAGLFALAGCGIVGSVVGAYYYLKIVKIMYFDEAAGPMPRVRQPIEGAMIALAALMVSPAGYLLVGPLGRNDGPGRGSAFLTRIRIVETTGSTNADLLSDAAAVEGDWLVALEQSAGKGRQGRQWVSETGNFFGSTLVELGRGDPPAQSLSLVSGLALIEAVDRDSRAPIASQMAERPAPWRREARRNPARTAEGAGRDRLRSESRRRAGHRRTSDFAPGRPYFAAGLRAASCRGDEPAFEPVANGRPGRSRQGLARPSTSGWQRACGARFRFGYAPRPLRRDRAGRHAPASLG